MLVHSAVSWPANSPLLMAKVRSGGVELTGVEVLDLSLAGCMLEWRGWTLREEQRVLISFPTLANLPASVLWSEKDRVGLLFNNPLHEAVYDHLVRGYSLSGG
ncbi:PilZ domain-containing protein [Novosphingobium flavum]|uniref:PilZ domain-containing protein n=1 Tax=Novosphingobium flavum TaxID=1778672 RepID=A0A7X1FRF4_9SPHN|nr:PilZ domain-containing protein [Novosphingobium flavum]MBC2665600.1 PilZ domain-containing protein [Novosphingobium flavum]